MTVRICEAVVPFVKCRRIDLIGVSAQDNFGTDAGPGYHVPDQGLTRILSFVADDITVLEASSADKAQCTYLDGPIIEQFVYLDIGYILPILDIIFLSGQDDLGIIIE